MADRCTIMGLCIDSVNSLAPLIHGQISEAISLPAQPSNETGRDAKRLGRICERLTWPTSISRSVSGIGDRLSVDSWPTVLCTLEGPIASAGPGRKDSPRQSAPPTLPRFVVGTSA